MGRAVLEFCSICVSVKGEPGWRIRYNNSLRTGRSGDRIPVGARFSAPVETSSEAHPTSYTMGTVSFPGVKRQGRGVDNIAQYLL